MGHVGHLPGHQLNIINCSHQQQYNLQYHMGGLQNMSVHYNMHKHSSVNLTDQDIPYCIFVKKYQHIPRSRDNDQHSKHAQPQSSADFWCDFHHLCDSFTKADGFHERVQYNGVYGTVYCCHTDLCNNISQLENAPTSALSCYKDTSDKPTPGLCPGASHCVNVTDTLQSLPKTQYNCDMKDLCVTHAIPDEQCRNVIDTAGGSKRVCCCAQPDCNWIPSSIGQGLPGSKDQQYLPSTPLAPAPSPAYKQSHRFWPFLLGLLGALVLAAFAFVIIAIVIKKHRQQKRDEQAYSYTQLTADLTEEREDDVMIVG